MSDGHDALLQGFEARRPAALARAVSIVENHREGFDRLLAALHPRVGRARRIGITGPPGAGKSTLTTCLAAHYRRLGLTVGIVAVDPTSPFTGGALLGDRVRMESVALDAGIYIRSMATRGSLGGLASTTREVADVLDAYGFDRVLIETVGVGQTELDIARTADSAVVVLVPESGDAIQTMKAGLMEIADLFVVNKADRAGADRLRNEIELMLGMRAGKLFRNVPAHHGLDLRRARRGAAVAPVSEPPPAEEPTWTPPVLATVAARNEGTEALADALDRHFVYLEESGTLGVRRRQRLRDRVMDVVDHTVRRQLWGDPAIAQLLEARLPALEAASLTPFDVADEVLKRGAPLLAGRTTETAEEAR